MLTSICSTCSLEFQAPLELAGKTVKCPRCKGHVRIASLFDEPEQSEPEPTTTPTVPPSGFDVFARTAKPETRSVRAQTAWSAHLGQLVTPLVVLALLVTGWLIWSNGSADDESGQDISDRQGTPGRDVKSGTADNADIRPAASREGPTTPSAVGITDQIASVFQTIPPWPCETGFDLVTAPYTAICYPQLGAWVGDAWVSTALGRDSCIINWSMLPTQKGAIAIDAYASQRPSPGMTASDSFLGLDVPVDHSSLVSIKLSWPLDDRCHRLRCWIQPDGTTSVAFDEIVLAADRFQKRTGTRRPIEGLSVSSYGTPMKVDRVRLYTAGVWQKFDRSGPVDNQPKLEPEAFPTAATTAAIVDPTYAPYLSTEHLDPGRVAYRVNSPERQRLCANFCAEFIRRFLRPTTQMQYDLAARLIWLGRQMDASNEQIKTVEDALRTGADGAVMDAIPSVPIIEIKERDAYVGFNSIIWNCPTEIEAILNQIEFWMNPSWCKEKERPHLFDWSYQIRNHPSHMESYPVALIKRENMWTYAPVPSSWERSSHFNQMELKAMIFSGDGNPSPLSWAYITTYSFTRAKMCMEDAFITIPWDVMYGDGDLSVGVTGNGSARIVVLGNPDKALVDLPIAQPDLFDPQAGGIVPCFEPALVITELFTGKEPSMTWRPLKIVKPTFSGAQPGIGPDMTKRMTIGHLQVSRRGSAVTWRFDGIGSNVDGSAHCDAPIQVLIRPDDSGHISLVHPFLNASPRPLDEPRDSLSSLQAPSLFVSQPAPTPPQRPSEDHGRQILALSQYVLTANVPAKLTVFLSSPPESGEGICAVESFLGRMTRSQYLYFVATDSSQKTWRCKASSVPPKSGEPRYIGFRMAATAPGKDVSDPASNQPLLHAIEVEFTPGAPGVYQLYPESQLVRGGPSKEAYDSRRNASRLIVVPAKTGWSPTDLAGQLYNCNFGFNNVLMSMCGLLQCQGPGMAARPDRPAIIIPSIELVAPADKTPHAP